MKRLFKSKARLLNTATLVLALSLCGRAYADSEKNPAPTSEREKETPDAPEKETEDSTTSTIKAVAAPELSPNSVGAGAAVLAGGVILRRRKKTA